MTLHTTWRHALGSCFLAVVAVSTSGCLSFVNPVDQPAAELVAPCQNSPQCCRDHVYIFLIHGLDPLDLANLGGVRDYIHQLGFNKVYYGQLYHKHYFQEQARRIHREDADAHFVLVGFSFGANMVRDMAQTMKKEGVAVDLLMYLGGNTLENVPADQPENARRIVNILASGKIWHGDNLDRAENVQVPDVWHFGSPTHPETLQTLARELAVVASLVPLQEPVDPSQPAAEGEPVPGKPFLPVSRKRVRGEWDFLKPVSQLRPPQPLAQPPANAVPTTLPTKPATISP